MIRIKRLIKSFKYALRGLIKIFHEEQNLRVQSLAAGAVILAGLYFGLNRFEWALILIIISMVILMEIANSAVERVTDVLKPRIDTYVKEIKDIMAAAVMLASILAIVIGAIIFWPHVFN